DQAKAQAERGLHGKMEGHAEMDMAVTDEGPILKRIMSDKGKTAISHYFVMDWLSVWKDVAGGLLIAGALKVWVTKRFWRSCFMSSRPLAAVLWNSGISFGGVIAFI